MYQKEYMPSDVKRIFKTYTCLLSTFCIFLISQFYSFNAYLIKHSLFEAEKHSA